MGLGRKIVDSVVVLIAGYSLFVVADRIASSIIKKFPMTVGISDFSKMVFFSAMQFMSSFPKDDISYTVALSLGTLIFMTLIHTLMSDGLREATSRHATELLILFLLMGAYEKIMYLAMAKNLPELYVEVRDMILYLPAFISALIFMTLTSALYFVTLRFFQREETRK